VLAAIWPDVRLALQSYPCSSSSDQPLHKDAPSAISL
jgi:hypothetical protein